MDIEIETKTVVEFYSFAGSTEQSRCALILPRSFCGLPLPLKRQEIRKAVIFVTAFAARLERDLLQTGIGNSDYLNALPFEQTGA